MPAQSVKFEHVVSIILPPKAFTSVREQIRAGFCVVGGYKASHTVVMALSNAAKPALLLLIKRHSFLQSEFDLVESLDSYDPRKVCTKLKGRARNLFSGMTTSFVKVPLAPAQTSTAVTWIPPGCMVF